MRSSQEAAGPFAALLQRIAASRDDASEPVRALVVFAHSDDEVLALGGRLERFGASRFLTITDGAPQNGDDARHHGFADLPSYREARRDELRAAMQDAGLSAKVAPVFPAAVPDQQASFHLQALARALATEFEIFRPEAVLTHPYEGGHPDHDACAFAVHAAVALLARCQSLAPVPVIVEAPFYHADRSGHMVTGRFREEDSTQPAVVRQLTHEEQERKRRRLACFPSQAETLAQFGTHEESFRIAPHYVFSQPPHAGRLFYEQFPWGVEGRQFCGLAAAAEADLFGAREGLPLSTHKPVGVA